MNKGQKRLWTVLMITALCLALTCACLTVNDGTSAPALGQAGYDREALFADRQDTRSFEDEITIKFADIPAFIQRQESSRVSSFRLPASLQVIEDEAFEGTAAAFVELPESLESIGERAFADIRCLQFVKIPDSVKKIAKTAFAGSAHVAIAAAPGSYAGQFARENGLPFAAITVVRAETDRSLTPADSAAGRTKMDMDIHGEADEGEHTDQWRPLDEIKQELFDQCTAHGISGRAPPANA